jgi:hypothetical protein
MGFLRRLFGGEPACEDRFWRTTELKLADLTSRIVRDADPGPRLLVYHFEETGERLQAALEGRQVSFERLRQPATDALAGLGTRAARSDVVLLASEELPPEVASGLGESRQSSGSPGRVHLAEHFPVSSRDREVLNLTGVLPAGSRFFCYAALDEPWLAPALDSRVLELLGRMGLEEDAPIEHPILAKAARRVQAAIEGKLRGPGLAARSCEEWMRANLAQV